MSWMVGSLAIQLAIFLISQLRAEPASQRFRFRKVAETEKPTQLDDLAPPGGLQPEFSRFFSWMHCVVKMPTRPSVFRHKMKTLHGARAIANAKISILWKHMFYTSHENRVYGQSEISETFQYHNKTPNVVDFLAGCQKIRNAMMNRHAANLSWCKINCPSGSFVASAERVAK